MRLGLNMDTIKLKKNVPQDNDSNSQMLSVGAVVVAVDVPVAFQHFCHFKLRFLLKSREI